MWVRMCACEGWGWAFVCAQSWMYLLPHRPLKTGASPCIACAPQALVLLRLLVSITREKLRSTSACGMQAMHAPNALKGPMRHEFHTNRIGQRRTLHLGAPGQLRSTSKHLSCAEKAVCARQFTLTCARGMQGVRSSSGA